MNVMVKENNCTRAHLHSPKGHHHCWMLLRHVSKIRRITFVLPKSVLHCGSNRVI